MNTKVAVAVERLKHILPLAERQECLDREQADVYREILNSYVDRGTTLSRDEIAQRVGNVDETVNEFRDKDMVVFDARGEPTGAYPFTSEPREYQVAVNGHKVYCMCALDALAVSPMFAVETAITSKCSVTGEAIGIRQFKREILSIQNSGDVYFGISWNAPDNNCCATSLCTEMVFLVGQQVAERWCSEDTRDREIFELQDAVDFAASFFTPLMADTAA